MRVLSVVGARPNFMKLAAVARAVARRSQIEHVIVHTGQHYDPGMSAAFFKDLGIPEPDHNLGVGSGSHSAQTAAVMLGLEPLCLALRPDVMLVYGDVNSTVAAALVAAKSGIVSGHVEAGVRSRDRSMPEEVNRIVTDRLAEVLLTPTREADENLRAEGVEPDRIRFVGNVMIDSLVHALPGARLMNAPGRYGVVSGEYVVATLHRPSNVDRPETLAELLRGLTTLARDRRVLLPLHPRTRQRLEDSRLTPAQGGNLTLLEPLGYLDMLSLIDSAGLVITDSGGLQAETTFLGVPCLTVRTSTEWPVTITRGTNRLVEPNCAALVAAGGALGTPRTPPDIEGWDGHAAERIVDVICGELPTR